MARAALVLAIAAAACVLAAQASQALPVYGTSAAGELSGSRSVGGGGLVGYNAWEDDFTVAWEITQNGSEWHYEYTFTGLDGSGQEKDISHTVLDISDDCDGPDCVFNVSPSGEIEYGDFDGVTGAVKFDFGGGNGFVYEFDSDRAPVYGHLAVKGGAGPDTCAVANPTSIVACSVGLDLAPGDPGEMDILNYVARPNGAVPEPTTGWLLTTGLLLAATTHRRMRRGTR